MRFLIYLLSATRDSLYQCEDSNPAKTQDLSPIPCPKHESDQDRRRDEDRGCGACREHQVITNCR